MKQLSLFVCIFLWQCVSIANATDTNGIETLIGESFSEGIYRLDLKLDEYFVIDEPPCVPRGIKGKSPSDMQVSLFVRRGDVPFRESCKWSLEEFEKKRIIGVIVWDGDTRIIYGEIPVAWRPVR